MIEIVVAGAGGRMGRANIQAILNTSDLLLTGALEHAQSPLLGDDPVKLIGKGQSDVRITADVAVALDSADALIDFTTPANSVALAAEAAKRGMIYVVGTTGCSDEDEAAFAAAASNGARVVRSGNFSLGVNLLGVLVKKAAAALDEDFDIEVLEMHHKRKVDAPSGTAYLLGEQAAAGRHIDLKSHATLVREGITGPREKGSIGFATLRGGDVIGDHTVMLVSENERIELTHKAMNRGLFADGAIKAVRWAADKPAGLYSMLDVLGLDD